MMFMSSEEIKIAKSRAISVQTDTSCWRRRYSTKGAPSLETLYHTRDG